MDCYRNKQKQYNNNLVYDSSKPSQMAYKQGLYYKGVTVSDVGVLSRF